MVGRAVNTAEFRHRQVEADGIPVHVVECGSSDKPTLLFLHGWPQSWKAFESTKTALSQEAHVVGIDLPGNRRLKNPSSHQRQENSRTPRTRLD